MKNKVFYLGPVPQKMVKLTQNLEPNFKHGFLVEEPVTQAYKILLSLLS